MLVPGHALERYGKRHTQRIPGAVRVLKRRLLPPSESTELPYTHGNISM